MSSPFNWLRLVRLVLAFLVLAVSVASGIPIGTDQGRLDPFTALTRFVGGVANLAGDGSSEVGGGNGALGEIVDEPIGTVGEPGAVAPPPPVEPGGAGGVLGGGESLGPGGSAVTPVAVAPPPTPGDEPSSVPPTELAAPTAITPAGPGPSPSPRPSPSASPAPARPAPSPSPTATIAPSPTPEPSEIRLDEPVLRFLPEINAAASATGVPAPILAGVVRVESNGDPNLIANGTRFGLSGVSEAGLAAMGIAPPAWHDPASNLLAGAGMLAGHFGSTGSWDAALEAYFGAECDATGACPADYRFAVLAWSDYYAGPVSNPGGSGFAFLPSDWSAPPIAPYQGASPRPIPLPPGVAPPAPTAEPTAPPTPTVLPTETPEVSDFSDEQPADVPTVPITPTQQEEPPSTPTAAPE